MTALAREIGAGEVLARGGSNGAYLREAGYRRWGRLWRLDTARLPEGLGELPAGGWRRALALLGIVAVPFFRGSRS